MAPIPSIAPAIIAANSSDPDRARLGTGLLGAYIGFAGLCIIIAIVVCVVNCCGKRIKRREEGPRANGDTSSTSPLPSSSAAAAASPSSALASSASPGTSSENREWLGWYRVKETGEEKRETV